ncbi:hypothetical protein [Spirosoma aerophilum]
MEDKETLLFEVKLDIAQVKEKAELARNAIAQLRAEKVATDKEFRDKAINADEYAKSMQAIETQLGRAQGQLKTYTKTLADNERATLAAEGSNDQLRAKLSLLVPVWNAASKADRQYNEGIKAVGQQIKALNDELKENEEAMGDHRRSVGDYAKGVRVAGVSVGDVQEALKGGAEAFQVFTKGISVTKGALIALGAVPILIFLTGLVLLVQKSQAAMDKLSQYAKAAELAFGVLTDGMIKNTRIIIEAFTSWDKFKNLFADLRANADATTKAMGEAARAGLEIAATNQRIEDSEIKLSVARAQARKDIEKYKLLAEDTSKSNTVRAAAAKKAFDLENSSAQEALKLQKQRIANLEREQKYGTRNREDARKLAEERIKLAEIEEDSVGRQTELNNNLNSIRQDGITKAKEAAALAAQESIAEAERALILAKQKGQDTLPIEEEIIRRKAKAQLIEEKKGAQQRKLIEAQTNAEILALRVAHATELNLQTNNITQAGIDGSLAIVRQGTKEELNLRIESLRAQGQAEAIAIEQRLAGKANEKQRQIEQGKVALQTQAKIDAARQQYDEAEIQRMNQMQEDRLSFEENFGDVRLSDLRGLAGDRIDLEEKTQTDLLEIQKNYGRISDEEYLTRLNAIQAKARAADRELNRLLDEDVLNDEKARIESRISGVRAGTKEELKARIDAINNERRLSLNVAKLTADQRKAINDKANREIKDAQEAFGRDQINSILDTASTATDALSRVFEAQAQRANDLLNKQKDAALTSVGLSAEARTKIEEKFAARQEELDRKSAERRRKIATIENIIATARGVTEALLLPPPFDIIKTALVIATGAAQQAVIASQQFAKGGIVHGPSHKEGGVKMFHKSGAYLGEMEGEEIVLTSGVYRDPELRAKASALNVAGGGIAFASETPRTYVPKRMDMGGIVTPPMISGASGGSAIDYNKLSKVMVHAVQQLPPSIIRVTSLRSAVDKEVKVESRADIGV